MIRLSIVQFKTERTKSFLSSFSTSKNNLSDCSLCNFTTIIEFVYLDTFRIFQKLIMMYLNIQVWRYCISFKSTTDRNFQGLIPPGLLSDECISHEILKIRLNLVFFPAMKAGQEVK